MTRWNTGQNSRPRWLTLLLALAPIMAGCKPTSASMENAIETGCQLADWSEPTTIGTGSDVDSLGVARFTSVVQTANGSFIAGIDLPLFTEAQMPTSPLTAWKIGGTSMGKPIGDFAFVSPRLTATADGTVHMVWGEPTTSPTSLRAIDWPPEPITKLWTARYRPDGGWSAPSQLHEGSVVSWAFGSLSQIEPNADLDPLLAVSVASDGTPNPPVLLRRLGASGWTELRVPVVPSGGGVTYPQCGRSRPQCCNRVRSCESGRRERREQRVRADVV
jgi:hypothetical protein